MARELTVRVITPERIVSDTKVQSVRVPGTDGSIGILPRHARMIAALEPGMLLLRRDGVDEVLYISGGFADVRDDTVRILTPSGEPAQAIDVERAKEAEKRARARIDETLRRGSKASEVDYVRANAALRRSLMRLRVYSRHGR